MSNEFTPTTEQVEDGYVHDSRDEYRDPVNYPANVRVHRRAFRRWHDKDRAEAQVEVLEDLATAHYLDGSQSTYDTIMRYADRIAREAGIETKEATDD